MRMASTRGIRTIIPGVRAFIAGVMHMITLRLYFFIGVRIE